MYIIFFDYDGATSFFGYLQNGRHTGFTADIAKARRDLDEINLSQEQPFPGNAATRALFIEGFVRRTIDIADDGSVKSRNHFSESFIVEFRLDAPGDPVLREPSLEKSVFMVFAPRFSGYHESAMSLEVAISMAKTNQGIAEIDTSTWEARAAEGDYPDFFKNIPKIKPS